jgi:hypothetical protein
MKRYTQGPPVFARGLELHPAWIFNAPIVHRGGECHCKRCIARRYAGIVFGEPVVVNNSKLSETLSGRYVGVYRGVYIDDGDELNKRDYPVRHEAPKADTPAFDDLDLFGDGNGKQRR